MKARLFAVLALILVFTISCNDDPDITILDAPNITAPSSPSALVGADINLDFTVKAPGKIGQVTVIATGGDAVVTTPAIGQTETTVSVTYTASFVEGTETITLTVVDQQDSPKTTTSSVDVAITTVAQHASELLVAKFNSAPVLDGEIDDMWSVAQKLVGTTAVPDLGARGTYLNSDGQGLEEGLGLFDPYTGEEENFIMRSGYFGDDIYFLLEWDDDEDSKDRESWYFDKSDSKWKQEHKYANAEDDKFYEDKFAFLFPIGQVDGFSASTCYASCHQASSIAKPKDKHTRHYLTTPGQKIDMWHWKRVRGTHNDRIDDQRITYVDPAYSSSSNGRGGDVDGQSGYSDNKQTLNNGVEDVSVPLYVIPGGTDYYWIPEEQKGVEAKLVTAVDVNGVLTFDGGTIDPAGDMGYDQGVGNKRFPSVITRDFTGARADLTIKVQHTGTGWIAEFTRKLNTGDDDDVIFNPSEDLPFGFAIFNNAAIAHAIKIGLNMKFEQ